MPFLQLVIPYRADFLLFKELYCLFLCHDSFHIVFSLSSPFMWRYVYKDTKIIRKVMLVRTKKVSKMFFSSLLTCSRKERGLFTLMEIPDNTHGDALHDSKRCLPYPHRKHLLLSCKASPSLVQGIRTTIRRHPYERISYFAMSR